MKMGKRLLSAALAVCVLLFAALPAAAQETKYPTTWDLTDLYEDDAACEAAINAVQEDLEELRSFLGTLDDEAAIDGFFTCYAESTGFEQLLRIYLYGYLGTQLSAADAQAAALAARSFALQNELNTVLNQAVAEIAELPIETRQKIFSDPMYEEFGLDLQSLTDPEWVAEAPEVQQAIDTLTAAMDNTERVYSVLMMELPNAVVEGPDGEEIVLDDTAYNQILLSKAYSREFKEACMDAYGSQTAAFGETLAALWNDHISAQWAMAKVDGAESTREWALSQAGVENQLYDRLIEAAHEGAADYQRYLRLYQEAMGFDEMYSFDLRQSLSSYDPGEIPFDEQAETVRRILTEVLGEEYGAAVDAMFASGHIDVYPSESKVTGAYTYATSGTGTLPYILLNDTGGMESMGTLAHEMGHAVYNIFTEQSGAPLPDFTHEVASVTNEVLFYTTLANQAQTEEEELYYLEKLIDLFTGTFFTQMIYAEFEDKAYQIVEEGGALSAGVLNAMWEDLYDEYRGGLVTIPQSNNSSWGRVQHFYLWSYYVYQYAAAICYAAAISQNIMAGEEGAVESYLEFLKAGGSAEPADLLKIAGVDPYDGATYDQALEFFAGLVDEYESLVSGRVQKAAA